ncbi:MAG: MBL fold metallo-hydrolase [Hyphomonadaceae bacterium]|nr:MBL fold metallo-hydrolase [Hyphomonadaceae bacterium]
MKWLMGLLALLIVVAGASAYLWRGELAVRLVERAARQGIEASLKTELPDGLHALFCGTGSPLPDRARAGPCLAVIAGQHVFVFDAGEGASETLALMGVSQGDIEAVFLTHLHSDHFDGLAPLALQHWATASATAPLNVVGPVGAARVAAGLNEAYAIDAGYRTAHHGPEIMPPSGAGLLAREFVVPAADGETLVVHDADGVRILAFRVDHAPTDAVGYRVEYGGRVLVISGDTSRSPSLTAAARGADLLVHEVISPRLDRIIHDAAIGAGRENVGAIFNDILDYHTSPADAGAVAQEAGVGALALTHFLPQTPIRGLARVFVDEAKRSFPGPVWAMRDGDVISLPRAGGVRRSHHLRF